MTVRHSDLTGADLHEPKGIATANAGEVYKADGLGSGAWGSLVAEVNGADAASDGDILIADGLGSTAWSDPDYLHEPKGLDTATAGHISVADGAGTSDWVTGDYLFEPVGADSANSGDIYVSDGSNSGAWTAVNNTNKIYLNLLHNTLDTNSSHFIVSPLAGNITNIWTVLDQAIAGGDAVVTAKIGGAAVTNGVVTIAQSGSAAGDVDSATPTAANTVTAGQAIEFESDGGTSTTGAAACITIEIDVS